MWHVSSRSGVATLRTAIRLLLTYLITSVKIELVNCRNELYNKSTTGRSRPNGVRGLTAFQQGYK